MPWASAPAALRCRWQREADREPEPWLFVSAAAPRGKVRLRGLDLRLCPWRVLCLGARYSRRDLRRAAALAPGAPGPSRTLLVPSGGGEPRPRGRSTVSLGRERGWVRACWRSGGSRAGRLRAQPTLTRAWAAEQVTVPQVAASSAWNCGTSSASYGHHSRGGFLLWSHSPLCWHCGSGAATVPRCPRAARGPGCCGGCSPAAALPPESPGRRAVASPLELVQSLPPDSQNVT